MKYLLLLIIFFATIYGYYFFSKTKDVFNPVLAFSAPILISVIVNLIFYDGRGYDISDETYFIYLAGVVSFLFGCLVVYRISSTGFRLNYSPAPIRLNNSILICFKIFSVFGTFISVLYIWKAAFSGYFGNNVIRNIRYYSLYVQQNSFFGKYSVIFIEVLFCIYAYKVFVQKDVSRNNRLWLVIVTIEYIIAFATTMARTVVLQFVLEFAYLFLYGITSDNKKKNKKNNVINPKLILLGIVALYIMQMLAEKTSKSAVIDDMSGETRNWLVPYFGKEFYVFDTYIRGNDWVTMGINSMGFIGRLFQKLGILSFKHSIDIPGGQVGAFITGPYTDFGIIGVIILMIIYGMIIGYIFKKRMQQSGWWTIFYAISVYSCVMAFYAFQFMMSSHLYVAILIVLLHMDNRARIHVRIRGTDYQKQY